MSEDWTAVSNAINERVNQLGWSQRKLAERAHVSQAIVREIQLHTVERRRSIRTLTALSITLGWHPEYLAAVLRGHTPPAMAEPASPTVTTVWPRLDALEKQLNDISARLDELKTALATVIRHVRPSLDNKS